MRKRKPKPQWKLALEIARILIKEGWHPIIALNAAEAGMKALEKEDSK